MDPWISENWKTLYSGKSCRTGLRLKFDRGIDPEVRRAIKDYCKWLRKISFFLSGYRFI